MNMFRFSLFIGHVFVVGCGRSPVAPSPQSPNTRALTGSWTGSYIPLCPGAPNCGSVGAAPSGAQQLSLVLDQNGDTISGQINLSGWLPRVANVTGTITPDGVMTLQGGDSWPRVGFCQPSGGWSIASWNGRLDAQSEIIGGDFAFVTQKHLSSCYYTQDLRVNATNLVLRHGAANDPTLAGHWQGTYAVLKCTAVGWQSCSPPIPDYEPPIDLQLSQSGNVVTGTLTRIPYSNSTLLPANGTTSSNASRLNLTASRSEIVGGGTHVVRLTAWSVTIDAIGRMQGTFSYIDEVHWTEGPSAGTTWSSSYDAELRYVVRVPW